MGPTAVVWLVVALLSFTATLAVLVSLIRHVFVVGRAVARFQEEVAEVGDEIARLGRRARERPSGALRRPDR